MAKRNNYNKKKKSSGSSVAVGILSGALILGTLGGAVAILNNNYSEIGAETEDGEMSLEEQVESLTADKEKFEAQVKTLTEEINVLKAERDNLLASNVTSEEEIASLTERISLLESEKVSLETLVSQLQNQLSEINQGRYQINLQNEEITITWYDNYTFKNIGYFEDITSVLNGETVDYKTVYGEVNYDDRGAHMNVYYFNGSSDNGSYAIRRVNIIGCENAYVMLYKGEIVTGTDGSFKVDGNKTITYDDLSIEKNTYIHSRYMETTEIYWSYGNISLLDAEKFNLKDTPISVDGDSRISLEFSNGLGEYNYFYIVGNNVVSPQFPGSYYASTEGWDDEGNYNFKVFNLGMSEEYNLKLKKDFFVDRMNYGGYVPDGSHWYEFEHEFWGVYNYGSYLQIEARKADGASVSFTINNEIFDELFNYYVENFSESN